MEHPVQQLYTHHNQGADAAHRRGGVKIQGEPVQSAGPDGCGVLAVAGCHDQINHCNDKQHQANQQTGQEDILQAGQHIQHVPVGIVVIGVIIFGKINAHLVFRAGGVLDVVIKVGARFMVVPTHALVDIFGYGGHGSGSRHAGFRILVHTRYSGGNGRIPFFRHFLVPQQLGVHQRHRILVLLQARLRRFVQLHDLVILPDGITPAVGAQVLTENIVIVFVFVEKAAVFQGVFRHAGQVFSDVFPHQRDGNAVHHLIQPLLPQFGHGLVIQSRIRQAY